MLSPFKHSSLTIPNKSLLLPNPLSLPSPANSTNTPSSNNSNSGGGGSKPNYRCNSRLFNLP